MLNLLTISSFALIDELQIEFESGLNLLTGETGSGKSIIVDALGVLIGGRFASEMIKSGESRSTIEGLFTVEINPELSRLLENAGIRDDGGEIIVRRELAAGGRNKIFINNRLATQSMLRELRPYLVDIHGQGEQQTLLDPATHIDLLDAYGGVGSSREQVAVLFREWSALNRELDELQQDEAAKLQLIDLLRFQIDELERADLTDGEDERLEEERRRLTNIEKLSHLSDETFRLIYDDTDSAFARLGQAMRRIEELTHYDSAFAPYIEGLNTGRAVLEDLSYALRDFHSGLEFSPERLAEIENRLAELSRLKRKYGGTVAGAIEHLERAQDRFLNIERSEERERELQAGLIGARESYLKAARHLHRERLRAAKELEAGSHQELIEVALENARLEVQVTAPSDRELSESKAGQASFAATGIDRVEFYFSGNVGEPVRPLSKVASGGEASRLMLVLKTVANAAQFPRTIVFDEIDSGIGGRVSEAVGSKLKKLAETHQVLCVTHQAQIARFADSHFIVQKEAVSGRTEVSLIKLDKRGRVEEIARMLTGADITETARRHAREMLKTG